ncbi:MAG TPA: hypothetical protein VEB22_08705, partial [Phycisphaerales bacterium]|nr:hypothetical protein [Phycisphaerales bacterium]
MTRNRFAAAITAGTLALAASAAAQPPSNPLPPRSARQAPVQQNRALNAINAQQLARAAIIDGRSIDNAASGPGEARYLATLLRDAAALDPANAQILRFAIEAAEKCGDQQSVSALTRALIALNPDDTSAQLNLIRSRVALAQSVEDQLNLLDTFTGPRGESIDASIRSRLALDAALLRREQGDGAGFVKNLTAATTFDGSNAAAATLALEYYSARAKDDEGRFELLANALLSMPMDGGLHAEIARVLAAAGATGQALRFYENARAIYRRQSGQLLHTLEQTEEEARLHAAYLIQAWRTDGPESVVKPLNDAVDGERRRAQVDIDVATATGNAVDRLPTPDSIRLPIPLETVRAAAAYAAGDRSTLDRSLADLSRSIAELAPDHPSRTAAMVEAAYLKALARGGDINADISALRFRAGVPPKALQHLEAWAKLRSGNRAGRTQFEAMKDDPIATLALLAIDVESTPAGDTPAAKAVSDRLAALAYQRPETTISAWAMSAYRGRNEGKTLPVPERAEKFSAMAAGIPAWLDGIAAEPGRFITVRAEPAKATLNQLEPVVINIQISNNTPVPLAVGPDQTIDSRMLLVSAIDIGGTTVPAMSRSEVAVLGGRLRLLPRETATFSVWADP